MSVLDETDRRNKSIKQCWDEDWAKVKETARTKNTLDTGLVFITDILIFYGIVVPLGTIITSPILLMGYLIKKFS